MARSTRRKEASAGSEAARLRESIDSGETRDKVDYSDPAVVPLGTDAEAGGRMASAGLVHEERVYEEQVGEGFEPNHSPEKENQRGVVFLVAMAVVICVILALIALGLNSSGNSL